MGVRVHKAGWDKTALVIKRLQKFGEELRVQHMRQFAELARDHLVSGIEEQRFELTPLTTRYLKWKVAKGYDRRVLIRKGNYVQSIVVGKPKKGTVALGIDKRKKTDAKGYKEPLWKLARWLEYGTKPKNGRGGMPERPHWRVLSAWIEKEYPAHMRKLITRGAVERRVRSSR